MIIGRLIKVLTQGIINTKFSVEKVIFETLYLNEALIASKFIGFFLSSKANFLIITCRRAHSGEVNSGRL